MGSFFLIGIPKIVDETTTLLSRHVADGGALKWIGDIIITQGDDFGFISLTARGPGLSVFQLNIVIYGMAIILFLIFEPLGLFGIWLRIRNYWKGWPFTY